VDGARPETAEWRRARDRVPTTRGEVVISLDKPLQDSLFFFLVLVTADLSKICNKMSKSKCDF
jgi:hypothetical protein